MSPALSCAGALSGTSGPECPHTPQQTAKDYGLRHPDLDFVGEEQELDRTRMSQSIPSLV